MDARGGKETINRVREILILDYFLFQPRSRGAPRGLRNGFRMVSVVFPTFYNGFRPRLCLRYSFWQTHGSASLGALFRLRLWPWQLPVKENAAQRDTLCRRVSGRCIWPTQASPVGAK